MAEHARASILRRLPRAGVTRRADGPHLQETFLVGAVATVLVVRWLLDLTGYPRLGGGGLHVAHLLWGGLLMLAGLLLVFRFLDRSLSFAAAVLSGVGFGLFIDEIGKFLTADSDYFYRPAAAIIYVLFVVLFLLLRVADSRTLNSGESLANALVLLVDGVDGTLDPGVRRRLADLLERSDPAHPLRAPLVTYVAGLSEEGRLVETIERAESRVAGLYERAVANRWFERG